MRLLTIFAVLSLLSIKCSAAGIPEQERCRALQTTLASPLGEPRETTLTITSACTETDIAALDPNDPDIRNALKKWARLSDELVVRRYTLTFEPTTITRGRNRIELKFSEKAGIFSPYKAHLGDGTLHVAAGTKAIMSFLSPHRPDWITSSITLRFIQGDEVSQWTEEFIQMLMPAWTDHIYEGIRFE